MLSQYRKTATLFLVCQNWHSGQWSRGYRIMCMLQRRLERNGFTTRHDLQSMITDGMYKKYVAAFKDKL